MTTDCCAKFREHDCAEFNNNKKITVSEKRSTYIINNQFEKLFCKIKIDGCYITNGKRCDWLIINCDGRNAYFVELKGKNVSAAIEQIHQSIVTLSNDMKSCKLYARIVPTKNPLPDWRNTPEMQRLRKLLKQHNRCSIRDDVEIKRCMEENVN